MAGIVDPDTYVNWNRTDEPGEHPRWESKCGVIIQTRSGEMMEYWGFHFTDEPLQEISVPKGTGGIYYNSFTVAKTKIEKRYFALHPDQLTPAY